MDFLAFLSGLCGWVYTLSWSLSFYPQPLLNLRRRSTVGSTVDFPFLNSLGFLAYLLSTGALRWSPAVRAAYAARHHGQTPAVATNDVVFSAHALVLTLVTLSQYVLPGLWGWQTGTEAVGTQPTEETTEEATEEVTEETILRRRQRHPGRPSWPIVILAASCVAGVGVVAVLTLGVPGAGGEGTVSPLFLVYALGYVKLVVTLAKYAPQVLANRRQRSTDGWSIMQILLDAAGGVLSLAQLALDSARQHAGWSGLTGNPAKLGLGGVSLAYDAVFVVQHYVLYHGRPGAGPGAGSEEGASAAGKWRQYGGGSGNDATSEGGGSSGSSSSSTARPPPQEGERAPLLPHEQMV